MKIAIFVSDLLFQEAEQLAQAHGLTRSDLYVQALRFFLASQQAEETTACLNAVYADDNGALDSGLIDAQTRAVLEDGW